MSHSKERHEKNCLNCNTEVVGKYCHLCGQENIEPKESVWGIVSHFFYDITHFDGKFFSTVRYLAIRPGFLSKEYINGRRASYLHPIRMYVFTSALFFLIFFSVYNVDNINIGQYNDNAKKLTAAARVEASKKEALKKAKTKEDSLGIEKAFKTIETIGVIAPVSKVKDSTNDDDDDDNDLNWNITGMDSKYQTHEAYDSAQQLLPADQRDGWWERRFTHRNIDIHKKYPDRNTFGKALISKFIHSFPYLLFVSLPLYALFLKLLYIRRKEFYYVNHVLFMIHLYIFTFLLLLVILGLDQLREAVNIGWLGIGWIEFILFLYGIYYTYKAMKNFYGQGFFKTFLKFMALNILATISIFLLFGLFFLLTVFRI